MTNTTTNRMKRLIADISDHVAALLAEERRKALADAYQAAHDATTHPSAYACREAIRALSDAPPCEFTQRPNAPAREVTVREAALPQIAARWLAAYDASMSGTKPTEEEREISQAIGLAACFAGAAYENEPSEGADVAALARAFLTALMDVTHPDLDYLRADPKAGQVAREVNDKLRALSQGGEG